MKNISIIFLLTFIFLNSCSFDQNDPLKGKIVELKRRMIMQKIPNSDRKNRTSSTGEYYLFDSSIKYPINDGMATNYKNRYYIYKGDKVRIVNVKKTCFDARGWITVTRGYYIDDKHAKHFFSYEENPYLGTPW